MYDKKLIITICSIMTVKVLYYQNFLFLSFIGS